jgi:hypothetical protein
MARARALPLQDPRVTLPSPKASSNPHGIASRTTPKQTAREHPNRPKRPKRPKRIHRRLIRMSPRRLLDLDKQVFFFFSFHFPCFYHLSPGQNHLLIALASLLAWLLPAGIIFSTPTVVPKVLGCNILDRRRLREFCCTLLAASEKSPTLV